MTYNVVVPIYLGGEKVINLFETFDVDLSHLIIVDNTPLMSCAKEDFDPATVLFYPENIGVARAWNIGLKAGVDWTFIVSQSMVFPGGFSNVLLEFDPTNEYCWFTEHGWHCAAISKKTVELIGLFDTNFYPAYFEDADYYRRMCLAGIQHGPPHKPPVATSSIGTSIGAGAKVNFTALDEYFREKWNGGPGDDQKDMFTLPFGDKPLSYFPERSVKELQNKYGYTK